MIKPIPSNSEIPTNSSTEENVSGLANLVRREQREYSLADRVTKASDTTNEQKAAHKALSQLPKTNH